MKVREVQQLLKMEIAAGEKGLDREITGGYCGDLLSDVMARAALGCIWLTVQSHQNVVAVGVLKELAAIALVNGRRPDEDARAKADEEGVPILVSSLSAYDLAGRLYEIGIGRVRD